MPDDPNKRGGADRKRVSQQPWEQAYQKRKKEGKTGSGNKSSSKGSNDRSSSKSK
ncbi:MAG: hypothetical protein ICV66_10095 [Chitinophagaceae bacterium]|nr:hypothetical protein [Chitinophagaceae bacterium]